jgi:flagellar brake protein
MAETEEITSSEAPSPRFEVERTQDYSQYLLHSRSEILAVLRSLIQKRAMISVYFDEGRAFFLTTLIALASENRELVFDIGSNEENNLKALQAKKLIFTALVDKVKIQFSLDRLATTESDGRPAFLGALPETLLRLQRREFFRLGTPVINPLKLKATLRRADDSAFLIDLPLVDISGGGIGLMATPEQAILFERGTRLEDARIMLPEEGILVTTLWVRNRFEVTARNGTPYVRIGCEYLDIPPGRLTMVQRYITRVERERKARLSGLA